MTAARSQPAAPATDLSRRETAPIIGGEADGFEGLPPPRRSLAIGAVLAAMAMVVIDGGLSNVALPTIAASLRVTPSEVILVTTSYQAAVVMMLLPSAALGERFGQRPVFAAGVGLFLLASLASALAPSLAWLALARFAQGLGASVILALGIALIRFSVPDRRLGAAIGWNALTVALSAAAGPALGALIISVTDWHALYLVNLLVGAAVMIASRALPRVERQQGRLDLISIALNCAVFGSAVISANAASTAPLQAAGAALAGILLLAILLVRERPKSRPLVPLDLMRSGSFTVSIIASILCFTGQTAGLIALPFYLQHWLGLTPAAAALYMIVWPLSVALTAPIAGRAVRSFSTGQICAAGGALLAAGLAAIALWPLAGGAWLLAPLTMMCGAGFGLFQVANNRNMFLAAPPARSAAAGGMQGTARLTGQTAGALLAAQLFASLPLLAAPRVAIGVGAVFTLSAGLISLLRTTRLEGRPT